LHREEGRGKITGSGRRRLIRLWRRRGIKGKGGEIEENMKLERKEGATYISSWGGREGKFNLDRGHFLMKK